MVAFLELKEITLVQFEQFIPMHNPEILRRCRGLLNSLTFSKKVTNSYHLKKIDKSAQSYYFSFLLYNYLKKNLISYNFTLYASSNKTFTLTIVEPLSILKQHSLPRINTLLSGTISSLGLPVSRLQLVSLQGASGPLLLLQSGIGGNKK